ncbi:HAMP domain-containing sensor histidine kinase [Carboxydothermus ferrireducens]|uniref:histidine kinase n=1 Tax=Carboxydothermus ferrireducens DSM 11255 TaxID=1119529 RepID=A0ABX2RD04_9THEO|nr:ATP-binding protein [Carboxydothermus ferrireducens]NYE57698.1 signal transduction histidine kinase [Carboxydothermus ferrireducens DSM 11255]
MKITVKITAALLIVAVLSVLVTSFFAVKEISDSFDFYVKQNMNARAKMILSYIGELYFAGGWEAVQAGLQMSHGRRSGGPGGPRQERIIITAPDGTVVVDNNWEYLGQKEKDLPLKNGQEIYLNGQKIGTLYYQPFTIYGLLEESFISSVKRANFFGGLLAVAVALVLGFFLSQRLLAPLKTLIAVVGKFSSKNLHLRAPETSNDEIGELARAFNRMAEALERNEKLRRQMIADIAHELRTPLSILQGNFELLLEKVIEADEETLHSLAEEVKRLSRLVEELRELSLAEAGELKILPVEVEVNQFFSEVAAPFTSLAEAKSISFETTLPAKGERYSFDPDRMKQVVYNLLTNAFQYTGEGGKVKLEVKLLDGKLLIEVTDTGPGIPPEDLPYIFERFYRGEKSRSRATGGSGLGLAIAKSLVEAHGGKIWVESTEGQGTTFKVVI